MFLLPLFFAPKKRRGREVSFLCAREKEGKKVSLQRKIIIRELVVIFYFINFDKVKIS
jgi:hypothetical protein